MADLLDTDVLLVNRAGVDHSVTKANLMATVQDTDLLLVNRAGVDYKATYADVKKGFGPQKINPAPGDWAFNPAIAGGTGTQADPFIITPETVNTPGGTVQSAQTLTLTGLTPNNLVEWTDHSAGAGNRFHQDLGLVPPSGQVDLRLNYLDTPTSTVGATFTGDLQIGTTYFRWVVTQNVAVAPVIGTVTLADSPEADRFTSATFATTVTMTEEGIPASSKGLKAWVEGTLKSQAKSSAITAVNITGNPVYYSGYSINKNPYVDGVQDETSGTTSAITYRGTSYFANPINNTHICVHLLLGNDGITTGQDPAIGKITAINGAPTSISNGGWLTSVTLAGKTFSFGTLTGVALVFPLPPGPISSLEFTFGPTVPPGPPMQLVLYGYSSGNPSSGGSSPAMLSTGSTDLVLTDATDLDKFATNDAITEVGNGDDATGKVGSVDVTTKTISLSTTAGTWDVGSQVKGPLKTVTTKAESDEIVAVNTSGAQPVLTLKTDKELADFAPGDAVNQDDSAASGTVGSVDVAAKTMTLSASTGTWTPNAGKYVIGPTKPSSSVKLYTVHDAAGAVSDLQLADPGYVTMTGNSPYTLTFPATLPTGHAPDVDLPAGTTLTTEIQATSTGTTPAVKTSNTVTPA